MNKKITALLCGTMFAVSSIGFAAVSPDKIGIGGARPGMKVADLIAIYGQPNSKHGDDWTFAHFTVEVDKHHPDIVEKVVTRSSEVATPSGIAVGQDAEVLNAALGRADDVDIEHDGAEYEYFSTDRRSKIEFKVRNGIITKISCKIID